MTRRPIFLSLVLLLFTAIASHGQEVSFALLKAELLCSVNGYNPSAKSIVLTFDRSFRAASLEADRTGDCATNADPVCDRYRAIDDLKIALGSSAHYRVMRLDDASQATLVAGSVGTILQNTVTFPVTAGYSLGKKYVVIAKFVDSKQAVPAMIVVSEESNCSTVDAAAELDKPAPKKPDEPLKFSDVVREPVEKDSPMSSFELGLTGAKLKKTLVSIKADFRPVERRRFGLGGYYDWTYGFLSTEVRFNAQQNDRKNVLTVGSEFRLNRVFHDDGDRFRTIEKTRSVFPGLSIVFTPKLETEWGFKNANLIPLDFRGELPINLTQSRSNVLRIKPFIGFESGLVLQSETTKTGGWDLARPLFGAELFWGALRKKDKHLLVTEISYIQRLFLRPEKSFFVNDSGSEIATPESRRARGHVVATVTFNQGLFSPFLTYEYGRLPPKYVLQNSVFKTGIKFNVDLWWKKFQ